MEIIQSDVSGISHVTPLSKQYTVQLRNQGTTENSHTGHCTRNSKTTNIKSQKRL